MIWNDLNVTMKNLLWINEIVWILEICRKIFFNAKKGEDPYDVAVQYIKSTMLLDIMATLPQAASNLDVKFIILKNIRLFKIALLHYPVELLLTNYFSQRDKHYVKALVYAFSTIFKILVTLHYLGCMWIYVGSEAFIDFESDRIPWTIKLQDFEGYN